MQAATGRQEHHVHLQEETGPAQLVRTRGLVEAPERLRSRQGYVGRIGFGNSTTHTFGCLAGDDKMIEPFAPEATEQE